MVVYERTQGEPAKAWQAFTVYRDAGAARSYRSVAESLSKSVSLIERWGSRWNWQRRVIEYDHVQEAQARAEMARDNREMHKRHINEGLLLQQKGVERLQALDTDRMSVRDAILCIREGAKLERLARGEPTEIIETAEQRREERVERARAALRQHIVEFPQIDPATLIEWSAADYNVTKSDLASVIEDQAQIKLVNDCEM
jgi:hypothetical protein